VLRGLSPRELIRPAEVAPSSGLVLRPKPAPVFAAGGMRCQSCRFARQSLSAHTQVLRCDQERSPLYRLQVDPQGSCPYHQPREICSSG